MAIEQTIWALTRTGLLSPVESSQEFDTFAVTDVPPALMNRYVTVAEKSAAWRSAQFRDLPPAKRSRFDPM